MYSILENTQLNEQMIKLVINNPLVAKKVKPGQFVIVKVDELGERIPLTIADYDADLGTVTLIVQTIGLTTLKLKNLKVGDKLNAMVGPLGKETDFEGAKNILVIGGGVGLAIAYPSAKFLHNNGYAVDVVAGFRNKDLIILEKDVSNNSHEAIFCTDDGSNGRQGFVTDYALKWIEERTYDLVVCIGPLPMMKAVCNLTKKYNLKTIISLNSVMIDGTGMCGGCRVTVNNQTKFACVDGPDFDGHQVDFNELMMRNTTYREIEGHKCNLYQDKGGQ